MSAEGIKVWQGVELECYLGVSETLYSKSLGGRSGRREGALDKKLGFRLYKGEKLLTHQARERSITLEYQDHSTLSRRVVEVGNCMGSKA